MRSKQHSGQRANQKVSEDLRAIEPFMRRFGYIEPDQPISEGLIYKGLERYQAFHGLTITGRVDAYTIALINTPRCGHPENLKTLDKILRQKQASMRLRTHEGSTDGAKTLKKSQKIVLSSGASATQCIGFFFCRWNPLPAVLNYFVDASNVSLDPISVNNTCKNAFNAWSEALRPNPANPTSLPRVSFNPVMAASAANIVVQWVRSENDSDGLMSMAVAHSDYPPRCEQLTGMPKPVHLNRNLTWALTLPSPANSAYDIETAMLHEIGHILGADHVPSSVLDTIMHEILPPGLVKHQLSNCDINNVRDGYGLPLIT